MTWMLSSRQYMYSSDLREICSEHPLMIILLKLENQLIFTSKIAAMG